MTMIYTNPTFSDTPPSLDLDSLIAAMGQRPAIPARVEPVLCPDALAYLMRKVTSKKAVCKEDLSILGAVARSYSMPIRDFVTHYEQTTTRFARDTADAPEVAKSSDTGVHISYLLASCEEYPFLETTATIRLIDSLYRGSAVPVAEADSWRREVSARTGHVFDVPVAEIAEPTPEPKRGRGRPSKAQIAARAAATR